MNAEANSRRRGAFTRRLIVLPALVVALSLALTGVASAQTSFQARVSYTGTHNSAGCSNGAVICGTANIAGYGAANWNWYVLGYTSVVSPCGSTYTATTYFTLVSDPGSTLVVDESGNLCGNGEDGAAYRGYFAGRLGKDFGRPYVIVGGWTVDPASTGQFLGVTGSGTDRVNLAGAHVAGSYSGKLG